MGAPEEALIVFESRGLASVKHVYAKERGNCFNLVSICGLHWPYDMPINNVTGPECRLCHRRLRAQGRLRREPVKIQKQADPNCSYCRGTGGVGEGTHYSPRETCWVCFPRSRPSEIELCEKHKSKGGKYNCLVCAAEELSRAVSRIDYLLGDPNEMEVSDYDLHCDPKAVVKRFEAFIKEQRARRQ